MAVVKVAWELNLLSPLDSRQLASTDVTFCTVKAAFVRLEKIGVYQRSLYGELIRLCIERS